MEKTTTIKDIANRITRHPLLKDIPFETILAYTVDFIQIVGLPELYEEKTAHLKVENWRTFLPCDYVRMIQVRTFPKNDSFDVYRYATSSFHMSSEHTHTPDLTYKIQGDVMYTSNKEGDIEISYTAFATDCDGYPLIPDNGTFPKAIEAYIKREWFTVLFDLGRLNPSILQNAQQQYTWAVGRAVGALRTLSIDKAESLFNQWRTLLVRPDDHSTGFGNLGVRENYKIH